MAKQMKTNAMRILDAAGISYEAHTYELSDEEFSGQAVAALLGYDPGQVFKTLVARGDKTGVMICCIPVDATLDLKAAAAMTGNKKVELVHQKEILLLTGYVRGGVSPLGLKKRYPAYIDETCLLYDRIAVSAGVKGCQLLLEPEALMKAAGLVSCRLAV